AFAVYRCTPGDKFTELVLTGKCFSDSKPDAATTDTALFFQIMAGGRALGRAPNSEVFAYRGRVYARATSREVTGKAALGSHKRVLKVDGVKRLSVAGLLNVPDDCALFDIIQDQFGPA